MEYESEDRYALSSDIFEYIARNGICTLDEIAKDLTISKETLLNIIDILVNFGLLEYLSDRSIMISRAARVILD